MQYDASVLQLQTHVKESERQTLTIWVSVEKKWEAMPEESLFQVRQVAVAMRSVPPLDRLTCRPRPEDALRFVI